MGNIDVKLDAPIKHKVYMRDWYFNAGIVGFLEIILTQEEKSYIISNNEEERFSLRDGKISIEDNYIEFDASILGDNGNFAHLMFQKAFDSYGRYQKYINTLEKIISLIENYLEKEFETKEEREKKEKEIENTWNYKGAYTLLEKKYFELIKQPLNLSSKIEFNRKIKEEEFKKLSINDLIKKIEIINLFPSYDNNILSEKLIKCVIELKEKKETDGDSASKKKKRKEYSKNWNYINNENEEKIIINEWNNFINKYKKDFYEIYLDDNKYFDLIIKKNESIIKTLKKDEFYNYFYENDIVQYLSSYFADGKAGIKKQSGFLNTSVKGVKKENFHKKIVNPIIKNKIKFESEGKGRDKVIGKSILDINKNSKTKYNSLISFIGYPGATNYKWINSGDMYIDEISELLSWSFFAGLTDISKRRNFRFLFANQDSSVIELYRANKLLYKEFNDNKEKVHSYVNFLTNLILSEKVKTNFALQNTTIIDIQNRKDFYVKIHTLNISKEKAKFIVNNQKLLNILTKNSFTDIDGDKKNIGEVVLDMVLKNKLNYNIIYKLIKLYIPHYQFKKTGEQKCGEKNKNNCHIKGIIQYLLYLIENYKNTFYGGINMEGNLSAVYTHGQKFATMMIKRKDGNKIRGFVAKFLNYTKSGNINDFMNLFMRIHMAYRIETPYELRNIYENKDTFEAIGYSFINGLLNVNNKKDNVTDTDEKTLDKKGE